MKAAKITFAVLTLLASVSLSSAQRDVNVQNTTVYRNTNVTVVRPQIDADAWDSLSYRDLESYYNKTRYYDQPAPQGLTPDEQAEWEVKREIAQKLRYRYYALREEVMDGYRDVKVAYKRDVQPLAYKIDRLETCDWVCVDNCTSAVRSVEDKAQCLHLCGCFDGVARNIANYLNRAADAEPLRVENVTQAPLQGHSLVSVVRA